MTCRFWVSGWRLGWALAAASFLSVLANGVEARAASATRSALASQDADYVADVRFALDELEKSCGHFFENKGIDWAKVRRQFNADAKKVKSPSEHLVLLVRLLARLEDGHAAVRFTDRSQGVRWPDPVERTGAGMFWCRIGKKVYVKSVWNNAEKSGLEPGMQVVKVDDQPVSKWLDARREEIVDTKSFSTDHQADFFLLHQGLALPAGTALELELKTVKGKKKKRSLRYSKAATAPWGPAVFPEDMLGSSDLRWVVLEAAGKGRKSGARYGYVHVRRCPGGLPEEMDKALAALGDVDGMILDFRGNSGGGFDHDALFGRFVPQGKQISFVKTYASVGARPYGGPMVVIVDGTVRSAGETASGMFKEDGRAAMIGESPTAGMSASKQTLELPSGLFSLYFAVASNKGRFNGGRGIEGVGVIPHEIVEFEARDLAEGRDTLVERAKQLLSRLPLKGVPYDPARFGWRK